MPDAIYLQNGLTNANVVLVGGICYEKVGTVEHPADTFAIQGEFDNCFDCENRGSSSSSSVPPANPCDCSGSQPAATVTAQAGNSHCTSGFTVSYTSFTETGSTCTWLWGDLAGVYVQAVYYKATGLTDIAVSGSEAKCVGGKNDIPGAMCINGSLTLNVTDIMLDRINSFYDVSLG